jgi:hypothetical protein
VGGSCPKMYLGSSSNSTHKLNLESAFGSNCFKLTKAGSSSKNQF